MEKYSTEQLREAVCALYDNLPCHKKPDSHDCRKICWLHENKTRDDLESLLAFKSEMVGEYFGEKPKNGGVKNEN